jgi:hypothetical protein
VRPPSNTTWYSYAGVVSFDIDFGGPMADLWLDYICLVLVGLERLGSQYPNGTTDWPSTSIITVVMFLPQLLAAWAGGLLARSTVGRRYPSPSGDAARTADPTI